MILVLLGTIKLEFPRPLWEIERLIMKGKITEEVIVQNGHTKFNSENLKLMPFMESAKLDELYQQAGIIITHAGTGSIMKGVKLGKKVIAVPRLLKYNEHVDNHQLEIVEELSKMGYIYPWNEGDCLDKILIDIKKFYPTEYISKKEDVIIFLRSYIDKL